MAFKEEVLIFVEPYTKKGTMCIISVCFVEKQQEKPVVFGQWMFDKCLILVIFHIKI